MDTDTYTRKLKGVPCFCKRSLEHIQGEEAYEAKDQIVYGKITEILSRNEQPQFEPSQCSQNNSKRTYYFKNVYQGLGTNGSAVKINYCSHRRSNPRTLIGIIIDAPAMLKHAWAASLW